MEIQKNGGIDSFFIVSCYGGLLLEEHSSAFVEERGQLVT